MLGCLSLPVCKEEWKVTEWALSHASGDMTGLRLAGAPRRGLAQMAGWEETEL